MCGLEEDGRKEGNDWQRRREEEQRVGDGGWKIREEGHGVALAMATATAMGGMCWEGMIRVNDWLRGVKKCMK